jgi:serine/threonine-protein kinase HipA
LQIEIPKLLSASENVLEDKESDEDLRLLLAPGSSLGGARPKASIRDKDGHLAIAKFSSKDDEFSTVLWEAVALTLASKAGIKVPKFRIHIIADKPTLILRRFDRNFQKRIPFLSALSMIGATDNEQQSYLEIIVAIPTWDKRLAAFLSAFFSRWLRSVSCTSTEYDFGIAIAVLNF